MLTARDAGLDVEVRVHPTTTGKLKITTLATSEPPVVVDTDL